MSNERRRIGKTIPALVVPVVLGVINLSSVTGKPRFEMFQTIDVVQLIVSGMCFGAAIAGLVMFFFFRRRDVS